MPDKMTTLNKTAAEVIAHHQESIHARTDVTGFGLIGHAREMALASDNVSLHFHASRIPLIEGALDCIRDGHISGGLKANREFAECVVNYDEQVSEAMRAMLFDPQTAGGLLIAVSASHSAELSAALESAGVHASEIGAIHSGSKPLITVHP